MRQHSSLICNPVCCRKHLSLDNPLWIYAHTVYRKRSFPKHVKCQSKNRGGNGNGKFGDHVLEKSFSYILVLSGIALHMHKTLHKMSKQYLIYLVFYFRPTSKVISMGIIL